MKTSKIMLAIVAIFLCTNLVFAENPEVLANKMVAKLAKDVTLTESQKIAIQAKAKELSVKLQNAESIKSSDEKQASLSLIFQGFKQNVDSLFTPEQRKQLQIKRNERRNAAHNKLKSKK